MLMGVFMGDAGGSFRIQPLIAVRVIEVPVCVDQVRNRIAAQPIRSLQDARAGCRDPGINEHLAIGACQDGDIAARALEDTDIIAQLVNLYGRCRGAITDQIDDVASRFWLPITDALQFCLICT